MNGVVDGRPVNPRTGYLVEFNALWYNALRYALAITPDDDANAERRQRWSDAAALMDSTFPAKFLNEWGYMYDYVNGSYADPSVRPNMAVAIGVEYSPLSRRQRKSVLDVVTRELLTSKSSVVNLERENLIEPCNAVNGIPIALKT